MTALEFDITLPTGGPKVRAVKFTPERMEQIRNLVERGHKREDIAAVIGCTVGSLQVTCSRFGISLRPPKRNVPAYFAPAPAPVPVQLPEAPSATYTLRIDFAGKVRDVPLTIPADAIASLACAAEVRGMRLSELLANALTDGIRTVLV
jgi:hypothetical protein